MISLQYVVHFVISLLSILLKHVIEFFVICLMEFGQVRLSLDILGVLLGDLLLSGHTQMHPLHMVILILHEWRDGQI